MFTCLGLMCGLMWLTSPTSPVHKDMERNHVLEMKSEPENNKLHQIFALFSEAGDIEAIARIDESSSNTLDFRELMDGDVVIAVSGGKDAVILSCTECNKADGGPLIFRYLHNGLSDEYRNIDLSLTRIDDKWKVFDSAGTEVQNLTLRSKKILGRVVGIEKIIINGY